MDIVISVLKSANVRLIGQTLQMCYDTAGNKYDVPVFVINEPLRYEVPEIKTQQFENKEIKVY